MYLKHPIFSAAALVVVFSGSDHGRADARPATAIETREIVYREGKTVLKGFVAWDANRKGKRPGVLVVHEWWGHNGHSRTQAKRLAEAGYVGFALDMYGNGKNTKHPDSASAFMKEATKSLPSLKARFGAALQQLKGLPQVDSTKIAAVGYCFGGNVVLNMARAGIDLDAVASIHGMLGFSGSVDSGSIKPPILVVTGAADPMVPMAQVEAFEKAMIAAGARVKVVAYPNVKHAFTNPDADHAGVHGLAYDAAADKGAWSELTKLLSEVFPENR